MSQEIRNTLRSRAADISECNSDTCGKARDLTAFRHFALCVLLTMTGIAVLGTAQQLHSHLRGSLNTGATRAEVEAVLALVAADLSPENLRRAREQWADVKERKL